LSSRLTSDATERSVELLGWFAAHGRDLPWRRTRDPWAVLVSEVMLTQTQVVRVIPKYEAFLARFPSAAACAEAPAGEVVALWSGLGYNRRALNLHRTAVVVVDRHAGKVPDDLTALLDLPGIGPYTARAILAFAYERDVGVVDTNAARVLARWSGRELSPSEAQVAADDAVPAAGGWAWNQAMLDLGATICTARNPDCTDCPVRSRCGWALDGFPEPDPGARAGLPQSRFEGSDRQGRGRLVDALRRGPVPLAPLELAREIGWPDDPARAMRVAEGVVADGLAVRRAGDLHLP
jgi:A/G-specific adenine glycosylase